MGLCGTKEADPPRDGAPSNGNPPASDAPKKKPKKPKTEIRLVLIGTRFPPTVDCVGPYVSSIVCAGQGESGKSTIFKQMKIIQAREEGMDQGFTKEERTGARGLVYDNIVTQMKVLVKVSFDEDMEYSNEANKVRLRPLWLRIPTAL